MTTLPPASLVEVPAGAAPIVRRARAIAAALLALGLVLAGPAEAAVELQFRSKDFGATFPHAFIVLDGALDSTGEPVSANYGFTVRHLIGPSVLLGPVQGMMISESADYVSDSNRHFSIVLTDRQYREVASLVERWRSLPQPSYSLSRRNCVSFVAEVAAMLGLSADPSRFMRRPRAFLDRVRRDNLHLLADPARARTRAAMR